jgi:hypothetical protein
MHFDVHRGRVGVEIGFVMFGVESHQNVTHYDRAEGARETF